MSQREDKFLMDMDLTWFPVQTIFGKLLAGSPILC